MRVNGGCCHVGLVPRAYDAPAWGVRVVVLATSYKIRQKNAVFGVPFVFTYGMSASAVVLQVGPGAALVTVGHVRCAVSPARSFSAFTASAVSVTL